MACFAAILKSWAATVEAPPKRETVNKVKNIFFIVVLFYHKEKKYSCFNNSSVKLFENMVK